MRKAILLMILGLAMKNALAQVPSTTHWFSIQLPVVFNKHWQWLNEASYRTLGESFSLNQLFLRTGVRYRFNEKWNVATSTDLIYTRVFPRKSEDHFGKESRLWQEVNYEEPLKNNFSLQNRLRVEERFISETSRRKAYDAYRFRYRVGLTKDLSGKWSIQLTDEIMEQVENKKIAFNQNRVSFGGVYQFQPAMQLQLTYYWSKLSSGSQHIFALIFQKRILVHAKRNQS